MHVFYIWLVDHNYTYISGLWSILLCIMRNISTVFIIIRRDHGGDCRTYAWPIVTDLLNCAALEVDYMKV